MHTGLEAGTRVRAPARPAGPTAAQAAYLKRALGQPGGKLPLFDAQGKEIDGRVVRACMAKGWAEPWFSNPLKPDWLVCRITEAGRKAAKLPRG